MWWLRALALRRERRAATKWLMNDDPSQRTMNVIARLPDWLRRDLLSKDEANLQRAEKSL